MMNREEAIEEAKRWLHTMNCAQLAALLSQVTGKYHDFDYDKQRIRTTNIDNNDAEFCNECLSGLDDTEMPYDDIVNYAITHGKLPPSVFIAEKYDRYSVPILLTTFHKTYQC